MSLIEIILIGIGLSMDAFAVSICGSMVLAPKDRFKGALRFGLWFGFFQMLMPVLGFFTAGTFYEYIKNYDHWVALLLLLYLGGNMIWESREGGEPPTQKSYGFRRMLLLAVATSIDALAVGVSFACLQVDIWQSIGIIGIITFGFSFFGGLLGFQLGALVGRRANLVGGLVLVGIGIKVLLEHIAG